MRRMLYIILGLVFLVGVSPMFPGFWASWFANRHGCRMLGGEGEVPTCVVDGQDWGMTLYQAKGAGWGFLFTSPLAAIGAIGLLALLSKDIPRLIHRRTGG